MIAIGAACAALYFTGVGVVRAGKWVGKESVKAGHAIAKPFHRHHHSAKGTANKDLVDKTK